MAEAFLVEVATSIGSRLASYAQQQLLLSSDLDAQVQKLKRTMQTINSFLRDFEEMGGGTLISHSDQDWVSNLCNAVYDVDDVFDEILTIAERKRLMEGNAFFKKVKLSFSSYNSFITSISLARRIESIRENLDEIAKDRMNFASGSRQLEVGRQVESNYLSNNVVGRESEKDELISMLLDSNFEDNVSVIPILGVGGLGKSTLARYVFDDEKVKANFKDLRLWVPLLQGMSLQGVIERIVAIASPEQTRKSISSNLEELKVCLGKILNGKKYILVLDNVWNENIRDWHDLKSLLILEAIHGTRILLTTRSPIIAKNMRSVKSLKLQPIGNDYSWSLLESIVFRERDCHDPKLKEIGLKILPMCYNVPLAIRALAGVLATNVKVSFWSKLQNDTVSNLGLYGKDYDIMPILKLSYNYLHPSALKSCFSYCSLFPKGHEFDKNKLVILWIAQGFVAPLHKESHLSLEEEGAEYLDMLVNKGLLQDVPIDDSDISTCKLHDLMYELSSSVSVNQYKMLNVNKDFDIEMNIRHVSINYEVDISFKIPRLQSVKQLRTFILTKGPYQEVDWLSTSLCNRLIQSFICLRSLDLHGLGIRKLPNCIGKIIHLRYLDISINHDLKRLPNSITSLYNLQYLNLIGVRLTKMPKDMDKLINLSHLLMSGCPILYFPSGLDKLTNLHTLSLFIAGCLEIRKHTWYSNVKQGIIRKRRKSNCGRLRDLKSLNHLRGELRILIGLYKNIGSDAMEANLKGKKNIKGLTLDWDNATSAFNDEDRLVFEYLQPHNEISKLSILNYKGNKMPTWMSKTQIMSSLQNLTSITIENCYYITHVATFSRLRFLKSFRLACLGAVEYIESSVDEHESTSSAILSSSSNVFFPSLTNIYIDFLPSLKGWREHGEENLFFPCVSEVSIRYCIDFESLLSCPNVKTLTLVNVPHLRVSIRGGGSTSSSASWVPKLVRLEVNNVENMALLAGECLHNLSDLHLAWRDTEGSNKVAANKMLEKALESMISLKFLQVRGSYLGGISRLPLQLSSFLERLELSCCKENVFLGDGEMSLNAWCALKSLRSLDIFRCDSLTVLPKGIGQLTTLQSLVLLKCAELEGIPEGIGNLSSLSSLRIIGCRKLRSLPEGMTKLTQLKSLLVTDCPKLKARTEENVGEDWHKIQHIPHITIT